MRILICGATGFIGRNLLEHFAALPSCEVRAVRNVKPEYLTAEGKVEWIRADLRDPADAERAVAGVDVILQAAATTSGAKDIVTAPHTHITDNVVMNSYLLRSAHEHRVKHFVFFSCSVMYPDSGGAPVKETDFDYAITRKYFAGGWNKVYLEKMCEFYSGLGRTRFTAIRHSNVYGPYDKFDLERSHVFGATVAKVRAAVDGGEITVWGDGSEMRDLLHVDDLVDFVELILEKQTAPFELVNVGAGAAVSVRELVERIAGASGKRLSISFDASKPTIRFSLALDSSRARERYGWSAKIGLDEGIRRVLG